MNNDKKNASNKEAIRAKGQGGSILEIFHSLVLNNGGAKSNAVAVGLPYKNNTDYTKKLLCAWNQAFKARAEFFTTPHSHSKTLVAQQDSAASAG